MSSRTVRTFTDPDQYAASIRGTEARLTVTGRGKFFASLARIELRDLWMQRLSDNLPRITQFSNFTNRAVFAFRTRPGPTVLLNGAELPSSAIAPVGAADSAVTRSRGDCSVSTMSLPVGTIASFAPAIAGRDLPSLHGALALTPQSLALTRLKHLHAAAIALAEDAPVVLINPEAARGLEQALIEALVDSLGGGEVHEETAALRQHSAIMRRFHRTIEQHLGQPLYIPELCVEIGASARTLRVCCQEQLGMSPKRYLLVRRMHMARQALRESSPRETTVTEIATRFGFWQFGRFAGEYKTLFEETPSATLARVVE